MILALSLFGVFEKLSSRVQMAGYCNPFLVRPINLSYSKTPGISELWEITFAPRSMRILFPGGAVIPEAS